MLDGSRPGVVGRGARARIGLGAMLLSASCASLEGDPADLTARGSQRVTLLTGTTSYEADVSLTAVDGPIAGLSDSATATLDPKFGIQLEYSYFVIDDVALGAAVGARRFDPSGEELFGAGFDADTFWTSHWFLTSRWFLPAFGAERRWRPYVGLDLGYVPNVDLDATVDYGGGFTQDIRYEGDSFWTLGLRVALSALLTQRLSFELGTFYEIPLDTSDASFTLDIPGMGSSRVEGEIEPRGFVFYLGLAYSL